MSKPFPRRRAALIASLGAIIASSASLMAAPHGHGGVDWTRFGLGVAIGLSAVLLIAALVKLRMR